MTPALRWGPRRDQAEQPAPAPDVPAAQWSAGAALATRAATVLLWVLLAAGPLALLAVLLGAGGPADAQPAPPPGPDPATTAAVGEFAQVQVAAWLAADEAEIAGLPQPDSPVAVRVGDPATAGLTEPGGPGQAWGVVVGITVTHPDLGPSRRYYSLPVLERDGALTAAAAPALVPPPPAGPTARVSARTPVPVTDPVGQTVAQFLTALLAGQGDIDRITSPGAAIAALSPAPYGAVTLQRLDAESAPPEPTEPLTDGQQLTVLATAAAQVESSAGVRETALQYPLRLAVRDGRWEVDAILPTPALSDG